MCERNVLVACGVFLEGVAGGLLTQARVIWEEESHLRKCLHKIDSKRGKFVGHFLD